MTCGWQQCVRHVQGVLVLLEIIGMCDLREQRMQREILRKTGKNFHRDTSTL